MTEEYRITSLLETRNKYDEARRSYDSSPFGSRVWRKAASALEFWGNKVEFLSHARDERCLIPLTN